MIFLATYWKAIAIAVVIGGLTIAVKVQSSRLASVKQEYAVFQAQVKVIGEQAKAARKAKEESDKLLKARLDNENKTLRNNLADTGKRLRDLSAGSGGMPQLPQATGGSDTVTLSRTGVNLALRNHVTEVRGILEEITGLVVEGLEAGVDLNTGREWVREQAKAR